MKKKILISVASLVLLFFLFLVWFDWKYSMDIIEPYQVNNPKEPKHLLIATQGSDFKDQLTENIVNDLKAKPVYISVIDVTTINDIETEDWDVIVILHTWEIWEPQEDAATFLASNYDPEKMVVMATSGDGGNMIDGVDGISGASLMDDIGKRTDQLLDRVYTVLSLE